MSNIETPYHGLKLGPGAFFRDYGLGVIIMLALLVIVGGVSAAVVSHNGSDPFILTLLGGLAIVGVFSLIALSIGLMHFGDPSRQYDLTGTFADLIDDAVIITSPNGEVLFANNTYRDLFAEGRSFDVPTVEQAFTAHTSVRENIFRLMQAQSQGETGFEEIRIPASDVEGRDGEASSRWFKVSVQPVQSDGGLFAGRPNTVWRLVETTGDRLREEDSVQKLQSAIENFDLAPVGFFSINHEGEVDHINAMLSRWLGFDDTEDFRKKLPVSAIMTDGDASLLQGATEEALRSKKSVSREFDVDLKRVGGKKISARLLCRFSPMLPGQVQTRVVVVKSPVSGMVKSDGQEGEMRFARFFHSAPIAIATVDGDGRIGNTNAAFLRMFKRSDSGRIKAGDSLFDISGASDRDDLEKALVAVSEEASEIAPVEITFGDHGERNGRLFISPIGQALEEQDAAIVYAIETTEQKALEVQIAQSQKMQAVGQLAGGIAHDFNNVLTAIIGFSDLLLTNHRPTDPAFKDIMNIKQNANRAAGLVRQLLAFSRQQTLRPKVLLLTDVISDLQVLLSRLLGEKISLKVVHGRDLWFVKADFNQFEQVIINLAVNARDAMSDGGQLTIRTENVIIRGRQSGQRAAMEPGEYVLCEVSDTGCGIAEDILEKIFEPFFSTKEVGKGTGLGLSTVYGIVKQTGGYIYPESKTGEGTVFHIYLPRHVEESDEESVAEVRGEKREKPRDLTGSGSVLLVEDEEAVRSFAARALKSRGYKVLEAASGVEALEVMEGFDGDVNLVVSDVVMPEMDGPTLLKSLRKMNPDLKIIFISGYAEEAFRNNLEDDEEFVFLPKPFSLKQLAGAVKEILDG